MRESTVEIYLHGQVTVAGGTTRKFVSPGHRGVSDRIVLWPGALMHFVETKAPGEKAKPHQEREHARMRALGFEVHVLDTKAKIDTYINRVRQEHLWIFRTSRFTK